MEKKISKLELIVVGAGIAGRRAALDLQRARPELQILILESTDRVGGRAQAGLHLVSPESARRQGLQVGPELQGARVRWEREWLNPDRVDWNSKEWACPRLPQWDRYLLRPQARLLATQESEVEVAVKTRSPVRSIQKWSDSGEDLWRLECPEQDYLAPRVIWAAGLLAFQNAFGKMEAQKLCLGNPKYDKAAGDFSGGVSCELKLTGSIGLATEEANRFLWAVPVRIEGRYVLSFGVLEPVDSGVWNLQVLMHLPAEIMADTKALSSTQKSLRRAWKHTLEPQGEGVELGWPSERGEKWVVQSQIGGQVSTQAWVLDTEPLPGLVFVGEDTIRAAQSQDFDTLAALESASEIVQASVPAQELPS
jgi:hypothetical protein